VDGVGRTFAEALARKDYDGLAALLDPDVDFRALTPSRAGEATGPAGVVDVLRTWFEDDDEFEDRLEVTTDAFADRERVAYRLYVRSGG